MVCYVFVNPSDQLQVKVCSVESAPVAAVELEPEATRLINSSATDAPLQAWCLSCIKKL